MADVKTGYKYHTVTCKTIQAVEDFLNKRDIEGWEYDAAYWGGSGGIGGNEYGVVVRRPR